MQRACSNGELGHVSDMAIVDTFTKLIFGEDDAYSAKELLIIKALREVDANVALDSHRDMGEYLRALGVREMIQMVARVQQLSLIHISEPTRLLRRSRMPSSA